MAELITKSACEIVSLLKAGEISIEDTLVALAERIEQVDTEINALPTLCFERAREAARQDSRSRIQFISHEMHCAAVMRIPSLQ